MDCLFITDGYKKSISLLHLQAAGVLLDHGCDLNAISMENEESKTPLLKAVELYHLEIAETLIKAGCDLNIGDCWGVTPLITAILESNFKAVELLVRAGCDVNIQSKNGLTPLSASLKLPPRIQIINLLMEANCNVSQTDRYLLYAIYRNNDLSLELQEQMKKIIDIADSPLLLQKICRMLIRKLLQKSPLTTVFYLPLPGKMHQYLNFS